MATSAPRTTTLQATGNARFGDVVADITATIEPGQIGPSTFKISPEAMARLESMPEGTPVNFFLRF